ncbi:biliverdin-producing heme oxygenase [Streptomyces sp. MS2A]|nr:biliverdin-producing heme oxygenase [Streptomyces sp. MS2A]
MAEIVSFSAALRGGATGSHSRPVHPRVIGWLPSREAAPAGKLSHVAHHYFIYEALEEVGERMRKDPVASVFLSDALTRLPALEADLDFLVGPEWRERIAPLPATARYVERIRQVGATWPGGFVAHHYTRYLGDLSGGLFIGRVMARRFGFETNGIGFYLFDAIADPAAFKDVYREQLDAAPWDEAERERVIDEVLLAYRFNTELFEELEAQRLAA